MKVKVGMVPGKVYTITLDEGTTVADAIRIAGLDPTGFELRVNSTVTENFNFPLSEGAQVFLTKKVKGNDKGFDLVQVKQDGLKIDVSPEEVVIESGSTRVKDVLKLADINIDNVAHVFVNGKDANMGTFVGKDALVTYKTKEQIEAEKAIAEEEESKIKDAAGKIAETLAPAENIPAPVVEEVSQVFDISSMKGTVIIKTATGEFTFKQ